MFIVLPIANLSDDTHCRAHDEGVIPYKAIDSVSHVIDLGHFNQHWNVVKEKPVMWIIIPGDYRHSLVRMKHVRCWRVVYDDRALLRTAQLAHVFHEDTVNECAVISEESSCAIAIRIHHVHQRVGVL